MLDYPSSGGRQGVAGSTLLGSGGRPGATASPLLSPALSNSRSGTQPLKTTLQPEPAYKSALERLSQASRPSTVATSVGAASLTSDRLQRLLDDIRAGSSSSRRPGATPAAAALASRAGSGSVAQPQLRLQPRSLASARASLHAASPPPAAPAAAVPQRPSTRPPAIARAPAPAPAALTPRDAAADGSRRAAADQALEQRLRERIERAKVEIKAQLSPMFKLSDVLLGVHDPQQAADALDKALGSSLTGFDFLAERLGSARVDGIGAVGGAIGAGAGSAAAVGTKQLSGMADTAEPQRLDWLRLPDAQPALLLADVQQGNSHHSVSSGQAAPAAAGAPFGSTGSRHGPASAQPGAAAAGAGGSRSGEDADSLVFSARAAVSKAELAIASLASPPRSVHSLPHIHQQQQDWQVVATTAVEPAAAASGPGLAAGFPPCAQLTVTADSWQVPAVLGQRQQEVAATIGDMLSDLPAADLEGRIAQLRLRSEAVIRQV